MTRAIDQRRWRFLHLMIFVCLLSLGAPSAGAAGSITSLCPSHEIQQRTADFKPGGIILTSFDKASLWVYNIDSNRRYPLPEAYPCGTNCRLSRDSRWITYVNAADFTYGKMRLDGTQRTPLVDYASDVEWWNDSTLLVWTPEHHAYLQVEGGTNREMLDVRDVVSIQPGGLWGVEIQPDGDGFTRSLVDLTTRNTGQVQSFPLGKDLPYFNASAWSPDGKWLAYVAQGAVDAKLNVAGGELFGIRPGDSQTTRWTDFTSTYGAVRLNGLLPAVLSWSPDSRRIAFWVIPLTGDNPETNTGKAMIHVLDTTTGAIQAYCGFTTIEHTPNPPRLIWSPDGTHLVFGGNVPGDNKGYLLLALDISTGVFAELSEGVFPALGTADAIAWGLPPP